MSTRPHARTYQHPRGDEAFVLLAKQQSGKRDWSVLVHGSHSSLLNNNIGTSNERPHQANRLDGPIIARAGPIISLPRLLSKTEVLLHFEAEPPCLIQADSLQDIDWGAAEIDKRGLKIGSQRQSLPGNSLTEPLGTYAIVVVVAAYNGLVIAATGLGEKEVDCRCNI